MRCVGGSRLDLKKSRVPGTIGRKKAVKNGAVCRSVKLKFNQRKKRNRLSLKEEMAKHRNYEELLKTYIAKTTWSMTQPAYCYTSLCPDPALRKRPVKQYHRQVVRATKVEKICLICRKRWPAGCGRKNCDCEGHGRLYTLGGVTHPKTGGGVDGKM